jgi:hypothetical protein
MGIVMGEVKIMEATVLKKRHERIIKNFMDVLILTELRQAH